MDGNLQLRQDSSRPNEGQQILEGAAVVSVHGSVGADPAEPCRVGSRRPLLIRTFLDEVRINKTGNEIILIKRRI